MELFNSKKIGEVLAYIRVGHEICEKGEKSLIKSFDQEVYDGFCESLDQWLVAIEEQSDETSFEAAKYLTDDLQKSMADFMDNYWNDPQRVQEWLGAYLGSAIICWSVLKGVAKQKQNTDLLNLTDEAVETLYDLFQISKDVAEDFGKIKN